MDGRVFVELISKLRSALRISNVDEALTAIQDISNQITPNSFLNNSTLLDEVLANIFTRSLDPKPPIALACQTFLDRWLSFYSAFAPDAFFRMVKKHSKTLARFMFKILPPFVFAYKTYFDLHSPELITAYQTIMEAVEPQYLCPMTKQVWVLYRDNSTIEQISKLIHKLLINPSSSFAVSVLVRKCPEQLVEQVFLTAQFDYILLFLQNLPLYVKFDTLTVSVRVSDAIFCRMGDIETAYQIIPYIIKRKLSSDEEAAFTPILPQLKKDSHQASALSALYAASKFGLVPISEIISLLHFSDRSDVFVRVESIKIGFELLHHVPFRDNFIKTLKELSQTRQTETFRCLLDNLTPHFSVLKEIDEKAAFEIVNNALSPTPEGENSPYLVLRFLISLDNLLDPKFTFDVARIIRNYTHLENSLNLIPLLKKLIYKLSLNIDSLNIDYFTPNSFLKLELVDSIDPCILTEAIHLGLVEFSYLPYVVDKLRSPYCFDGALYTLVFILKQIGFKADDITYHSDECWVTAEVIDRQVETLRVAFVVSELGKVIASLLRCIVELFDSIQMTPQLNSTLKWVANCLKYTIPDYSIQLFIKLKERNISFTYASPKFYANYVVKNGSVQEAVVNAREKIVAACLKDYSLATTFAPILDQPLPPLPTYHAFEGIEKHQDWLELSREHFLPEQVIVPMKKITLPDKTFTFHEVQIREGIKNVLSGKYMSLITFMYFSDQLLPISFEELEDYVIKTKDMRLFVGFFNYAYKHQFETKRLEEWTEKIKNNGSSIAFYAVSLFLCSIKVNLSNPPPCILNFITRSLNLLNIVHFSKKSVAEAFWKHSGVQWFFIRSIVSLDTSYFDNYPLILAEFAPKEDREQIFIDYFNSLGDLTDHQTMVDIFISLSSIYFHTKITYNKFFFPICHKNLLSFVTSPSYPIQVSFSEEFSTALLNLAERQTQLIPSRFFTFFTHCKLPLQQWRRLRSMMAPKYARGILPPYIFYIFPCLYFNSRTSFQLTMDDTDKISIRPPSFTRAFCRSLLLPIAPTLSQQFIMDCIGYLTPVFPSLSYPLLPVSDKALLYEKLLLHVLEPTPEMFTVPSRETFFMFKAAMKYANPLKKNELATSFLRTLVSPAANIEFVAISCHELKKLPNIGTLITMREIVNGKNFLMFCIMLKKVEKLREENWEDIVLSKLENEEKRKVFSELGTAHIVRRAIDCSINDL